MLLDRPVSGRAFIAFLLAAPVLSVHRPAAAPRGYAYDVRVTAGSEDANGRTRSDPPVAGRARVNETDGRVDITLGDGAAYQTGDWLLTTDAGRSLIRVRPRSRSYAILDLKNAAREDLRSKFIDVSVSGLSMRADTLAACSPVDGHATTCYEVIAEYDITTRYFLIRSSARVRERTRYWVRADLADMPNPAVAFLLQSLQLDIAAERPMAERYRRLHARLFAGAVVRMEQEQAEVKDGKSISVERTQLEVHNITRAEHPDSLFDLPAGYTRSDS